jgi:hypothetical protein
MVEGSGRTSLTRQDARLLVDVGVNTRKRAEDYANLLAHVNQRIAQKDNSVSRACVVTYIPPGQGIPEHFRYSGGYAKPDTSKAIPTIVLGIDMVEMAKSAIEFFASLQAKDRVGGNSNAGVSDGSDTGQQAITPITPRHRLR